jgi:hypothetical protein
VNASKVVAVVGFLVLALSPSFVDWQQSPELRGQMVIYYIAGVFLVYFGLDGWATGAA